MRKTDRAPSRVPFRQGDFDGLCGVYAVLNAVDWLLDSHQRLPKPAMEFLFAYLVQTVDDEIGLLNATLCGMEIEMIMLMLKAARLLLRERHGIKLEIRRPLRRLKKPSLALVLDKLQADLSAERSTYLLGLGGHHQHWSVCIGVGAAYLLLHDSTGIGRLRIANCRMWYEPRLAKDVQHELAKGACIRIRSDT